MKLYLKRKFVKIKAYAKKDFAGMLRYKLGFLNQFFAPFLTMASIFVTYSAIFFGIKEDDLGFVQKSNYVLYLVTGFLVYTIFRLAWGRTSLLEEKFMQTLEGILLAPGSRLYILLGKCLRAFADIFFATLVFVVALIFLHPSINWLNLWLGILVLFCLFVIFISLDFILTAIELSQEGIAGIIQAYVPKAFLLIGCVYFPIDVIPKSLRFLAYLNPLYHATNIFRSAFMTADLRFGLFWPTVFIVILAIILPFISVKLFEYIFQKWGIKGY